MLLIPLLEGRDGPGAGLRNVPWLENFSLGSGSDFGAFGDGLRLCPVLLLFSCFKILFCGAWTLLPSQARLRKEENERTGENGLKLPQGN